MDINATLVTQMTAADSPALPANRRALFTLPARSHAHTDRPHMHTRCTCDARLRHARTSTTRLRPGATNAHRHAPPMSCRLSILDPRRCCLALLLLLGAVAEQCCTAPKSQLTPTTWCGFSTCEGARSRAMRAIIVCSEGKAQPGHRLARPRRLEQSRHKKRQRSVV